MTGQILRCALDRALATFALLLVGALGVGSAQNFSESGVPSRQTATPIHDLSPAESIPFSGPPPAALVPEVKCDLKGNIFLLQSGSQLFLGSGGLSGLPISKLSIDSKSTVVYAVPSIDGYRGVVRTQFDVSADGHVYAMLEGVQASPAGSEPQPTFFVAKYSDDGSLDSYLKLEDPPDRHLQPFRFAMFSDGNILVTGTAVQPGKSLQPFVAIMDNSGRFVKYVKLSDDTKPTTSVRGSGAKGKTQGASASPTESQSTDPDSDFAVNLSSNSHVISAPDGNVYVLRGDDRPRLHVISSAGEVIRSFEVPPPAPGLTPMNLATAGRERVFIAFGRVEGVSTADRNGPNKLISVVSPQTGEVTSVYRLPADADAFNVPACAASADNFFFVGTTPDQQHEQVTRYVAR